jgi:hypothetical protein
MMLFLSRGNYIDNKMNLEDLKNEMCNGGGYTGTNKHTAILRFNTPYNFVEYRREELQKVFDELSVRIMMVQCGIDSLSATDKFLMSILNAFCGE